MSSQTSSPSGFPPSMGPGARAVRPGQDAGSILKEVSDIRSHYSVSVETNGLAIAYELKGAARHYNILFENIPLGGISRSLLFGGRNRTVVSGTYIIDAVRGAENVTGQILNQREVEGFALHSCKRLMYMYAGTSSAFVFGMGMAYYGRKDMKFPFLKPRPPERYNHFPSQYLSLLKGNPARIMWHFTRTNVYIGIGLFLLNPLFAAMGDTSMMVGLYRDDRTKDVVKSMKGSFDRIKSNQARSGSTGQTTPPSRHGQSERDSGDDQNPQTFYGDGIDADYGGDRGYTDGTTDAGILSDATLVQGEARQQKSMTRDDITARPQPTSQPLQQGSDPDIFFDDASPTAGTNPDTATSAPYQPSGSVWDRIRRGGTSQPPRSREPVSSAAQASERRAQQRGENETLGDSFSFSNTDEEKQLAKQQAQREFDALLERERRGSGSNDYEKAMNATASGKEDRSESVWSRMRKS